jgi:hypothetical protein
MSRRIHLLSLPNLLMLVTSIPAVVPEKVQCTGEKIGVDIIFPTILAMDKTHIDLAGHLQMEPILLKHGMRSKPIAIQIIGYINHSSPAHFPQQSTNMTTTNSKAPNRPLPAGIVIADAPLKHFQNICWPTCSILNKVYMQIDFSLNTASCGCKSKA